MNPTVSATKFPFNLETTVGAIVVAHPALARVFERLGMNYCCGGKKPLAEACRAHGHDPAGALEQLRAALAANELLFDEVDCSAMTLTQLADHIEGKHHEYVKAEPGSCN